jgi:hypothetical protein
MAKKAKPKSPFVRRWRITWMEQWDQEFVDAEVEGWALASSHHPSICRLLDGNQITNDQIFFALLNKSTTI